jgi:DNA-binding GntR family transcriptional regulator
MFNKTMPTSVADHVRAMILKRELLPGERLIQSELAERLGVSRTPVREALQKLAAEGLVTLSPYKGARVARLSVSHLEEIYHVRIAVESQLSYLAAQHITPEELDRMRALVEQMKEQLDAGELGNLLELNRQVNTILFYASRSKNLRDLAIEYMNLANLYRQVHFTTPERSQRILDDHEELLAALEEGDPETVYQVFRRQMQAALDVGIAFVRGKL